MRSDGDSILLMGRHQLKGLRWLNNSVSISSITTYFVPVPDLHVAYFCIIFNFNSNFFSLKNFEYKVWHGVSVFILERKSFNSDLPEKYHNVIVVAILEYICHRDTAIALIRAHFLSNVKNIALADSDGFITSERSATDLQM